VQPANPRGCRLQPRRRRAATTRTRALGRMHAYCEFPHVAMPMPVLAAPGAAGSAVSEALLDRARPVVRAIAAVLKYDGIDAPRSATSIGWALVGETGDADAAELVRSMFFDVSGGSGPRPRAVRHVERFQFFTPEQADALARSDPAKRLRLVAVRGFAKEVHIVRPADPEAMGHVVIQWGDAAPKASLVLTLDSDESTSNPRVTALMTPADGGARTTWSAPISDAAACAAVTRLFDDVAPLPPNLPLEADAATIRRGAQDRTIGHRMPAWFCEHVASLAQEGFRLCVLLSAAQRSRSGAGRLFRLDQVVLQRRGEGRDERSELRALLHASSAQCVCLAHCSAAPEADARGVVLCLSACGQPILAEQHHRCAAHPMYEAHESAAFPGCCTHNVGAFLSCEHVRPAVEAGEKRPRNPGIVLQMPVEAHLFDGASGDARAEAHERNYAAVQELVACAVALAKVADDLDANDDAAARARAQARVQEIRRLCDETMREFEAEWAAPGSTPGAPTPMDVRARDLLAGGTQTAVPSLAATHAHLFPGYRNARAKQRRRGA